jgi:hypothetical protein
MNHAIDGLIQYFCKMIILPPLLLLFLPLLHSVAIIQCQDYPNLMTIPIYSNMQWKSEFNENDIGLVYLQKDPGIFDYCNLANYNPRDFQPLLNVYNQTGADWGVLVNIYSLSASCSDISPNDKFILNWALKLILPIQNTGAKMMISDAGIKNNYNSGFAIKLPGNDNNYVDNVPIHITNAVIRRDDLFDLIPNTHCSLINGTSDYNPLVSLLSPYSALRIFSYFLCLVSAHNIVFILYICKRLWASGGKSFARYLILLPELLNNCLRITSAIDPLASFNINTFLVSRISTALQIPIGIFSKFAILLVWSDTISIIQNAMNSVSTKHIFNNSVKLVLLLLFVILISVDLSCTLLQYYGFLSTNGIFIPSMIYACIYIGVLIFYLAVLQRLYHVIKKIKSKCPDKLKTNSFTIQNQQRMWNHLLQNTIRSYKLLKLSAIGSFINIIYIICNGMFYYNLEVVGLTVFYTTVLLIEDMISFCNITVIMNCMNHKKNI